jgi:hypothetical protein
MLAARGTARAMRQRQISYPTETDRRPVVAAAIVSGMAHQGSGGQSFKTLI